MKSGNYRSGQHWEAGEHGLSFWLCSFRSVLFSSSSRAASELQAGPNHMAILFPRLRPVEHHNHEMMKDVRIFHSRREGPWFRILA